MFERPAKQSAEYG